MSSATPVKRWIVPVRAWLVRAYKLLGLVALAAIFVGLVGFLVVNVFYLFNRSWIRPEILSPTHERVVEVTARIAQETERKNALLAEREQLQTEFEAIERTLTVNLEFQESVEESGGDRDKPQTYEALMMWREYDRSRLERERLVDRREMIASELSMLTESIDKYNDLIEQLAASPYSAAADGDATVGFVPYANRDNVAKGRPVYGCKLGLLWCTRVGTVGSVLKGEVQNAHPHSGATLRGVMFELHLTERWAAEENALFVGARPFWLL